MSRYLVMALVSSCGLAQGAMAAAQGAMAAIPSTNNLFRLTPNTPADEDLWSHKADPMTCDQTSFTINFPKVDPEKWLYVIRLGGRMSGYYPVIGDTTSRTFSGLDKKSTKRVLIWTIKLWKMPDGLYDWTGYRWANEYAYNNGSTPIRCDTNPRP